jgi:hypothetical protein
MLVLHNQTATAASSACNSVTRRSFGTGLLAGPVLSRLAGIAILPALAACKLCLCLRLRAIAAIEAALHVEGLLLAG